MPQPTLVNVDFYAADKFGHRTRFSDSSLYDEVCENCGATDAGSALNRTCPQACSDEEHRQRQIEKRAQRLRMSIDMHLHMLKWHHDRPTTDAGLRQQLLDAIDLITILQEDVKNAQKPNRREVDTHIDHVVEIKSRAAMEGMIIEAAKRQADTTEAYLEGMAKHHQNETQRSLDKVVADDLGVSLEIVVKARQLYEAEMAVTRIYFMTEWNNLARFKKREYVIRAQAKAEA